MIEQVGTKFGPLNRMHAGSVLLAAGVCLSGGVWSTTAFLCKFARSTGKIKISYLGPLDWRALKTVRKSKTNDVPIVISAGCIRKYLGLNPSFGAMRTTNCGACAWDCLGGAPSSRAHRGRTELTPASSPGALGRLLVATKCAPLRSAARSAMCGTIPWSALRR